MSHSVDQKQQKLQTYLDLYRLRQSSIAGDMHSNFAQPVVAAKNFAAAITGLKGDDENLIEAKTLASFILELTDQAYTVAYDLMRQNDNSDSYDCEDSMQFAIEQFGILLRLNDHGVRLKVVENLSSISIDRFVQMVILDSVKAVFIYLSRQAELTDIGVHSFVNDIGLTLEVSSNLVINADQLETESVFVNISKQFEILSGSLSIDSSDREFSISMVVPFESGMLSVKNE